MKRILSGLIVALISLFSSDLKSQTVFWTENFGTGCTQGNVATAAVPTASNGAWAITPLATGPGNGSNPNEWFVSAMEAGMGIGNCGDDCTASTNRSLHVGANVPPFLVDPGAAYGSGGAQLATNKRAESPVINCTGQSGITLAFSYLAGGVPGSDFCEVEYSTNGGGTWTSLGVLAPQTAGCAPQGVWTATTFALPVAVSNNANVKIGFRWQNIPTGGVDPSVAIDDIQLSALALSFTIAPSACLNNTVQASITGTVPGTTSYSWSSTPAGAVFAPATSSVPLVTFTASGVHTVTAYALNGTTVLGTATQTINITALTPYTITPSSATVCPGQTVGLTVQGGVNYTWSPSSSLSTNTGSSTIASPMVQTTYTVVGNNGAGCNGAGQVTVFMGAAPNIQVAATASAVCAGFSSTLTAIGATSYTWTGSTMTVAVSQSSIAVGPGSYTLQASNGSACSSQTVITITQAPPLNVTASQSNFTTCVESNFPKYSKAVQLTANGASTYNWFPCNNYIVPCVGSIVQVRPPTSTCYTVTGNTSVCTGSAVVCVTVIPQFTVAVTPPLPIMCAEDSLKLTITNIGSLSIAPYTYFWTDPEPVSIYNMLDYSVTAFPVNTTNSPKIVTYTTEVWDSRGCVSLEKLVTVTVIPRPLTAVSVPTINGVVTNTLCYAGTSTGVPDVTLTLKAENTNGLPPQFDPTFTWTAPPTYSVPSPFYTPNVTNGPVSQVGILAPKKPKNGTSPFGIPYVTYTVVSGYNGVPGCRREDTVTVRVVDCRSVTILPTTFTTATVNDTICSRQCVTFINPNDTAYGGPQTYTWTFPGGNPNISYLKEPTVCYNLPGKYNVILKVANPYPVGVGSSAVKPVFNMINVVDIPNPRILPQINFQGTPPKDTTIRFGTTIGLSVTGGSTFIWGPNYNISSLTGSSVSVSPQQTTQYIVESYNSRNCRSSDTINVIVIDDCGEMFIPNAFSPNSDGVNDLLYVRGQCLESFTFMIFNRWGEKVWETNDKTKGWDGTYKGELLNSGVFVYRLEGKTYEGKGYSMKGNVTLVR